MKTPVLIATLFLPLLAPAQDAKTDTRPVAPSAPAAPTAAQIAASASTFVPRCIGPTTMGGRIADIAVYEKQPRIFYVAAAEGGIWKTENDGITFTPQFQKENIASLGCVTVSQKDPNLVWVGTGEPSSRNSVGYGNGIFKSTDGGTTWKCMGLESTKYISKVVIDPSDNNVVYAGALGNLWAPNEDRGLYKTTDGGKTWKRILFVDDKTGIADLQMDPSNHNILVASMWQRQRLPYDFVNGGPGGGMWRSTDAGKTWKKVSKGLPPGPFGRIGLNFFRKDSNIMVASIEYRSPDEANKATEVDAEAQEEAEKRLMNPGYDGDNGLEARELAEQDVPDADADQEQNKDIKPADTKIKQKEDTPSAKKEEKDKVQKGNQIKAQPDVPRGGIYISHDKGASWKFTNSINPRPFYFSIPRYDPNDVNRIYVPGVSASYTDDGGKTFRVLHETVHVDHHAWWIDPNDSNHMIVGEDGGVGVTYDRGKNWRMLNNLPIGQFYIATYDMRQPYWVYGGLQDNGCWATPTQTRHSGVMYQDSYNLSGGDGFYCRIDPNDWRNAYTESQGGGLVRTDQLTGDQKFIVPRAPKGERYRFNWNTPIEFSPFNSKTLYMGGNKLFRSLDRGDHWDAISPDLTSNDPTQQQPGKTSATPDINSGAEMHCTIVTISPSSVKAGVIWCGTDDGKVQLTQDDGHTWADVSSNIPGLPKGLWISRVVASKFSDSRCYVTVDGHRSSDFHPYVFMTDDYGKTWTSVANGLPDGSSVYVVQEGVKNQDLLFTGSETSIQISLDRGKTWSKYENKDFPTVPIYDLEIHPRDLDLIVATHGRAIWTINIAGLEQAGGDALNPEAAVFQPKDVLLMGRIDDNNGGFNGDQVYYSKNTQPGAEIQFYLKHDLADDAKISVSDVMGNATSESSVGKTAGYHTFNWNGTIKGRTVKPGDYRITLKAGGKEYTTSVHVIDVADTMQ